MMTQINPTTLYKKRCRLCGNFFVCGRGSGYGNFYSCDKCSKKQDGTTSYLCVCIHCGKVIRGDDPNIICPSCGGVL